MSNFYDFEYTDTFAGEANYSWVRRGRVSMPELTHYGYDGYSNYPKASKIEKRELMKKVKAKLGLTGARGVTKSYGDTIEFRPYGGNTVLFINWVEAGE